MKNGSSAGTNAPIPRGLKYLATLTSLVCGALIIAHAFYPQYSIDTTTIALIIVMIVPWLIPYIKSVKLPGGTEVIFRGEVENAERLNKGLPVRAPEKRKFGISGHNRVFRYYTTVPILPALVDSDPNLALSSLRIDIERVLREIAQKRQLPVGKASLRSVLDVLYSNKIIPPAEFELLSSLIDISNRAVHGAELDKELATRILKVGEAELSRLSTLLL